MIQVKRFSHATFETPDVERQVDYFSQVVGLAVAGKQNGHVHLATKMGDLAVQVNKASVAHSRMAPILRTVAATGDAIDFRPSSSHLPRCTKRGASPNVGPWRTQSPTASR